MIFLKIINISKQYQNSQLIWYQKKDNQFAIKNLSIDIIKNEIFALVGESGCGKTTLGRCLLHLTKPNQGQVIYNGIDLMKLKEREFRRYRPKLQMIFQNPDQALNPKQTIGVCLAEPIKTHWQISPSDLESRIIKLLRMVGLNKNSISRFPHELSGGQQQRVVIARALSTNPSFLIADEPTSSLDAVHKWHITNLLKNLQQQLGLTMLFISHDFKIVARLADRIGVMFQGELVEVGSREKILKSPSHPYVKLLLRSSKLNFNSLVNN